MTVKMLVGYPASGKSTVRRSYKDYTVLCRDELGCSIVDMLKPYGEALAAGKDVVLDATFATVEARRPFIEVAKAKRVPIHAVVLDTTMEEAQFNACWRMMETHGRILMPEDHKAIKDPNSFPVAVLYKYRKDFVPPSTREGFDTVDEMPFVRRIDPAFTRKAVILDADGTVRDTKSGEKWPTTPEDIKILPNRKETLDKWAKTHMLLGVSNQSGIAKGSPTAEQAVACFKETNRLLGHEVAWTWCPHKIPPVSCYCRKPGCGLGVQLIHTHKLSASECIYVGDRTEDKTFAGRCGFKFQTPEEFFGGT